MPEPTPPSRLLVTAFEPFGAPGRPKRPANASEEVLRAFAERHPGRCDLLVFPVDPRCEVRLARAMNANPAGVVAMGEAGLPGAWDTNVEVLAYDRPVAAAGTPGNTAGSATADAPARASARSSFAARLHLLPGMEREDRIGSYWCNRAYFRVLQWCTLFARPGVFLHLRVEGDRARQLLHLDHAVRAMEREAGLRVRA